MIGDMFGEADCPVKKAPETEATDSVILSTDKLSRQSENDRVNTKFVSTTKGNFLSLIWCDA